MAKLLFLVTMLLVASSALAHTPPPANTSSPASPPPPKPVDTFSLQCAVCNVADRCVTLSLEFAGKSTKKVVAESGCWTVVAPVTVSWKTLVVNLCATVKTDKGVPVTKSFPINLLDFKCIEPKCLKILPLLVCKSVRRNGSECLAIKVGDKEILSFNLEKDEFGNQMIFDVFSDLHEPVKMPINCVVWN